MLSLSSKLNLASAEVIFVVPEREAQRNRVLLSLCWSRYKTFLDALAVSERDQNCVFRTNIAVRAASSLILVKIVIVEARR